MEKKNTIRFDTLSGSDSENEFFSFTENVMAIGEMVIHFVDYCVSWGPSPEDEDNGCLIVASDSEESVIVSADENDIRRIKLNKCEIIHQYYNENPLPFYFE